jgi:hypothetical protein
MRNIKLKGRSLYLINVKIPKFLVDIIDDNLESGRTLYSEGFVGRAHFVEKAVIDKLAQLELITQQEVNEIEALRIRHRHKRHASKTQ